MFKTTFAALAVCLLALTGCGGDGGDDTEAQCIAQCEGFATDNCGISIGTDGVPNDQSSGFYIPGTSDCSYDSVTCGEQPYLDAYNAAWEAAGCTLGTGDDDDSAN